MWAADGVLNRNGVTWILAAMAFGLLLDHWSPLWGQIGVGLFFWGLLFGLYRQVSAPRQLLLMACLVWASFGEIFCSLVWGLYDYRLHNIPHYVPPGHVLMFLIGTALAPRLPVWTTRFLLALLIPYIGLGLWLGFDEFGLLLFLMFAACLISGPERQLYTTMFLLSLCLEIAGTGLGNWQWQASVPFWQFSNTNPPLASGAFYCVLDFLVLRTAAGLSAWRQPKSQNHSPPQTLAYEPCRAS